jgi:hypothetical protein
VDRGWVVLAGIAAVATGLVAALGGFAPTVAARPHRPGEVVGLLRWDLSVHRAELVPGNADHEPEVRVWFTVVNTTESTLTQPWGLVSLVLPEGTPEVNDWTIPGRSGGFDPDVPQQAYVSVPVSGWTGERTIGVQLSDESRSDTPAPIEVWRITGPVAQVDVVCAGSP